MKFRSIYLLAALPILVGAAMPFAFAGPQSGNLLAQLKGEKSERWQKFKAEHHQKMIEELGLSDEQVSQIKAIREGGKANAQSKYDALKTEMEAMRALVRQSASANELRAQHDKIQTLKQTMGTERFENMLKMYEILTPEQRTKFADSMKGRGGHWGRKGHSRHHRNPDQEPSSELQSMLTF